MHEAPLLDEPLREALRQAAAALDAAERRGQPFALSQALVQMARGYRAMHALASAETYLELALRWARATHSTDHTVDLLCELCEAAEDVAQAQDAQAPGSGHQARERARDHAFEASTLAGRVADPDWECTVLLRISDVLDRCGDRDDAVQLQARALRLLGGNADAADETMVPGLGRLADS